MKYKILCILCAAAMLLTALAFQTREPPKNRYHQHLEAQEKAPCTDHGEDTFCTHLPLVSITTDGPVPDPFFYDENGEVVTNEIGVTIKNEAVVGATVTVFDSVTSNNHLTDTPELYERSLVRTRGNSSRFFDKHGYSLKFKESDMVNNKDVAFLGMIADSDWALHGPFLDKTLIRNYLCYNMAGEIMDYAPNVRFCELFLNGEYQGLYLAVEKIDYNKSGRVNVSQTDPKSPETSFILKVDKGEADDLHRLYTFFDYNGLRGMESRRTEKMEIVYPGLTLTQAQKDYIVYQISSFEKSLASFDSGDKKKGYHAYIDVESFVEYFLINEFTANADAGRLSTYFAKDIRGKIYMIVWDFNNSMGNDVMDLFEHQEFFNTNKWFTYLLKDPYFTGKVVETYSELRKTYFSEEYLYQYIDDTIAYLGDAIDRNYEKWGYSFDREFFENSFYMLEPVDRNAESYEEAVSDLKQAIHDRIVYMDENIDTLYALCHSSVNKQFRIEDDN